MVKERKIYIITIIILAFMLTAASGMMLIQQEKIKAAGHTAVIEQNYEEIMTDNTDGIIRIKINPFVTVSDGTMQNLNFCNYNEDRLLKCRIKVEDKYVYESDFIEEGRILKGDFVKTDLLESGENEALAEIYSFSKTKEPMGQTNVKIILNLA